MPVLGGRSAKRGLDLPPGLPKLSVSVFNGRSFIALSLQQHSDSRNVKLPFRCTGRSVTFGVVVFKGCMLNWRGVDLPILVYWYSSGLCSTGGGWSATWSANMSSNSKNLKLQFRSTSRSMGGRSAGRFSNFEHTWCFMLCFTEGPFVYMKDLTKQLQSEFKDILTGIACYEGTF